MNPLIAIQTLGQSIWWDDIRRDDLVSGKLERRVEEEGIVGLTSNPAIFQKSIAGSSDYDDGMQALLNADKSAEEIYSALTIEDITQAADILRPVYERTQGVDGMVSIEVSPLLAQDTAGTIHEARQLWATINRPNLMIKVPATPEGFPAIRELIGAGINVNATLIFSLKLYEQVMQAYIAGLETLAAGGKPLGRITSVASFFVSRVDTLVDKLLDERIARATGEDEKKGLRALQGQAAIANAKLAYAQFKDMFGSPRFAALKEKGARVQRPLWASTSSKNPAYRDVIYVEELIGPQTVNTAPPQTVAAFKDHGVIAPTLEQGLDKAQQVMEHLAEVGVDMESVTHKLLADGVKAFVDSYTSLLQTIGDKRAQLAASGRPIAALGSLQARVEAALAALEARQFTQRLWQKDAGLWKDDEKAQAEIRNRLGWLESPKLMQAHCDELDTFVAEVRKAGFTHALLMGMGGSSMAPELFRTTFGVTPGHLDLHVLDTTDPASVLAAEQAIDLPHTLFIVSRAARSRSCPSSNTFTTRSTPSSAGRPGKTLSPSPTPAPRWNAWRPTRDSGERSSIRLTSAGAIARCPISAWFRRRYWA
jgi:transaldolase/glucose-6-phosphate isomerase